MAHGLTMTFRLSAQQHAMEFVIGADAAQIRMRSSAYGDQHADEGCSLESGSEPLLAFTEALNESLAGKIDEELSRQIRRRDYYRKT